MVKICFIVLSVPLYQTDEATWRGRTSGRPSDFSVHAHVDVRREHRSAW
ncbi:hypothetical protein WDV06_27095 [Streptomyces racemochromogenes]|uniref:Uncharacterized protein n=1 Tax=Streptomyces racemochromogenes TaxID=67353 RepID=A0ABW7PJZ0_9ACTN